MNFNDYLKMTRAEHDTRVYKIIYVDMVKDLKAGILLTQIIYWFSPDEQGRNRTRATYKGRRAIAKQRSDWFEELRMTEREYDSAIKVLKHYGVVDVVNSMFNAKRTPFIMINEERFMALYKETSGIDSVLQKVLHRNNTIRKTDLTLNVTPLTKTTTKSTTKNTSIGNFDKQNPTYYFSDVLNSFTINDDTKYYIDYYLNNVKNERYTVNFWNTIINNLNDNLECYDEFEYIDDVIQKYIEAPFNAHSLYHSTLHNVLGHRMQEAGLISYLEEC
jgi:hypothetical protein